MLGLLALAGCQALAYPLAVAHMDDTEKVPAEFSKLEGRKIAVVIWAESGTLYQFPHMRLELASQVTYQMGQHLEASQVVPPQAIADYQGRDPNWDSTQPTEIGKRFGADYVVFVELLEYSTREPNTPGLFRGRAKASVVVYDVADPTARWTLSPATAEYPSGRQSLAASDDQAVHSQLLEILGSQITAKFYSHEVPKDKKVPARVRETMGK